MDWFLKGFLFGFTISTFIGPIFIYLIQTGLTKGFKNGLFLGLGTWISDFILLGLSYFLILQIGDYVQSELFYKIIGCIGAFVLVGFGVSSLIKTSQKEWIQRNTNLQKVHIPFKLVIQGFLINTLNPSAFIIWLSAASLILPYHKSTPAFYLDMSLYYLGILGTIIILDILKIYLGYRIQNLLTQKHVMLAQKISGLCFILFGAFLLFKVLSLNSF
ncbi:MAG: LysE family transporter [Bacteroidota bacterium]|nr:LysE family transporter [Bacteroidota bacterium]